MPPSQRQPLELLPGAVEMMGQTSHRKWAGLSGQSGDPSPKLQPLAPPRPQTSWPSSSQTPAPPLAPAPRAPTASLSSLPPRGAGTAEARARLRGVLSDPQGVTSPLAVSISSCIRRTVGRTGSDQSPLPAIASPSSRPSPASSPGAPSARSAQPARQRLETILALSGTPASRVFCNLRLRLFSRAEPQPCSSSQWAA